MDNDMIVQYINGVQPDFSYGTSDGMSRAMVESVENMAMINDYITESTYEVITEAKEDKPGFWGKLGNKISYYFALFMRLVNKFITKIKGFFMTVKRKLTMAFAKAIKALGNFLRNRINNNKKKFDETDKDDEIKCYKWNSAVMEAMISANDKITASIADLGPDFDKNARESYSAYDDIVSIFNDVKESINDISIAGEKGSLLEEITVVFSPNGANKYLSETYKVSIDGQINKVYNVIMKSTNQIIKELKTLEKNYKKEFKKATNKSSDVFTAAKSRFKALNYAINQTSLIKYRIAGKIASACFKYYKKALSAVRKVFGGFNIFGDSGDYDKKEKGKKKYVTSTGESTDLLFSLQ